MNANHFNLQPSLELSLPLNENEGKSISLESEFNKNSDLIYSPINVNASYEKLGERNESDSYGDFNYFSESFNLNENGIVNKFFEKSEEKENNFNIDLSLIKKKRKLSEEFHINYRPIFTPSENDNDSRKLINDINSDTTSYKKKGKKKKKRKYNIDNINKGIKTHFFKQLKINTNLILKSEGFKKEQQFTYFQPSFISNTNKNLNKEMFQKKFEDFLLTDIMEFMKDKKTKNTDLTNYEKNISVLEDLKRNKCRFDFLDKTIIELFNEYLKSKEFKMIIDNLKNKNKEEKEYIKKYIYKANDFINYYS